MKQVTVPKKTVTVDMGDAGSYSYITADTIATNWKMVSQSDTTMTIDILSE